MEFPAHLFSIKEKWQAVEKSPCMLPIIAGALLLVGFIFYWLTSSLIASLVIAGIGALLLAYAKWKQIQNSCVDGIVVLGIFLGVAGILFSADSSKKSLNYIVNALYPQDFRVELLADDGWVEGGDDDSKPKIIRVKNRDRTYKKYGFGIRIKNESSDYPAQNIFVRVFLKRTRLTSMSYWRLQVLSMIMN